MMKNKVLLLVLAGLLLLAGTVGVLLGKYLKRPIPTLNTYTKGNVKITLTEETGPRYEMVPGTEIERNTKLTVLANSEDCWLFLTVKEENDMDRFIEYSLTPSWERLDGTTEEVFYYQNPVKKDSADQFIYLLSDGHQINKVKVREDISQEEMRALQDKPEENLPRLNITAYASSYWKEEGGSYTALEAWERVNPNHE